MFIQYKQKVKRSTLDPVLEGWGWKLRDKDQLGDEKGNQQVYQIKYEKLWNSHNNLKVGPGWTMLHNKCTIIYI